VVGNEPCLRQLRRSLVWPPIHRPSPPSSFILFHIVTNQVPKHQQRKRNNNSNIMSRFNVFLLLVLSVLVSTLNYSDALTSILRIDRRTSLNGRIGDRVEGLSPSSSSISTSMPALSSQQQVPMPLNRDMGAFDPDAYRKEMTELVYRRNLERGFSS
jgi:hypothetical protein